LSAAADGIAGALAGTRVLELGDQRCEFAGLLLAGLGAEVIKVEPRAGAPSRALGPFARGAPDPEQSLFFWRYNLNKKSVTLDLARQESPALLLRLAARADVIIDSGLARGIDARLGAYREFSAQYPRLVICTITPFGLDGPWRDLNAGDLVQLAMGGIAAVCGYDPAADGRYDTAPIAPAMWHSLHLAGEYAAIAITAALNFRALTGEGQFIDLSIHEAVSTCTEVAMPSYIYTRRVVRRQTARHAAPVVSRPWLHRAADGHWVNATISPSEREFRALIALLDAAGIDHELRSAAYADSAHRAKADAQARIDGYLDRVIASLPADEIFHRAQRAGLAWAPVRRPEENLDDPHFAARATFTSIEHPELGRELRYPGSVAIDGDQPALSYTRRAPRLGEHTDEVLRAAGLQAAELDALRRDAII